MLRLIYVMAAAAALASLACSGGGSKGATPTVTSPITPAPSQTTARTATGIASPTIEGGAATPSPATTAAAGDACSPADLTASAVAQGAEGAVGGTVRLTNSGARACNLLPSDAADGIRLRLRDGGGSELAAMPSGASGRPVGSSALAPAATASVTFVWTNYCGAAPTPPLTVSLTLAGGPPVQTNLGAGEGGVPTPRCDAPADPSALSISDVRVGS